MEMRAPWFLSSPAGIFYCAWVDTLHRLSGSPGGGPGIATLISIYIFHASIAMWILSDAQRRGHPLPYDYASLVFIFGFVFVPLYLFSSRGLRGLIPVGVAFLLLLGGILAALATAGGLLFLRHLAT